MWGESWLIIVFYFVNFVSWDFMGVGSLEMIWRFLNERLYNLRFFIVLEYGYIELYLKFLRMFFIILYVVVLF